MKPLTLRACAALLSVLATNATAEPRPSTVAAASGQPGRSL